MLSSLFWQVTAPLRGQEHVVVLNGTPNACLSLALPAYYVLHNELWKRDYDLLFRISRRMHSVLVDTLLVRH